MQIAEKDFSIQLKDLELVTEPFIKSTQTIKDVLSYFIQSQHTILPVVDTEGKYLGVVSSGDILANLDKVRDQVTIDTICRSYPSADQEESLIEVIENDEFNILPVTGNHNELIGFINGRNLINYALDRHKRDAEMTSQVVTSSHNGMIAINNDGIIVVYNPAAERILGRNKEEMIGKHISEMDPAKGLLETLETGTVSVGVKTIIFGRTILTNRSPLIFQGKNIGALGVFVDVSDMENITHELDNYKSLARELNTIINSSYDGLYICDKKGVVTRVNPAWERICGFTSEHIVGKTPYELVAAGLYNKSAATKAFETKKTCTVMLEMTSGPKKNQKIMATSTPVLNDHGNVEQVVVNVRDITEIESLKDQLNATRMLTEKYATELEHMRMQQMMVDDLIAQSPSMHRVLELATRVSQVESTVLVTGESGVGKEVIAKKIHLLSKRKNKALIKINCGAIPENLLESELFGYDGGAFTGAKKEGKPGMFELASGGTLFLDEIADIPLNLQVKLLRAIQEKEIIRVGGIKSVAVDVRIITATNKELSDMVKKGTFREDLFYRLNVVNIFIPPLRSRKEDIPPLLYATLKKFNQKYNQDKVLSEPVVDKLLHYHWPGNIRELENLIERLIVLVNENVIQLRHLPDQMKDEENRNRAILVNGIIPLKKAIEDVEAQLIENALREHGTTRKAAKILEVNQSTIVRKIKTYNLGRNDAELQQNEFWVHQMRI